MAKMSGAKAIIESLRHYGIDTIFGLPGGQLDHLFDAMYAEGKALNVIHTRHEQGAAYMAFGYSRATGREGVYTVVPGPGVLNTTAALCTAYACNAPVLCLTGQIPAAGIDAGRGYLHEIPNQLGILQSLTKWAERIETPMQAPCSVREAFKQFKTGRPRPVALEMAMDVMAAEAEVSLLEPITTYEPRQPDPALIEKAAQLLGKAKNPLIVIGGGALSAGEELLELAEGLQAPVVSFRGGRGVVSDRHYLSQSFPAGHRLWKKTDVVLALGTRFKFPQMYWGVDDQLQIIRVDIDPAEINRIAEPTVGVVADAKVALQALLPCVEKYNGVRESRQEELLALKAQLAQAFQRVKPQMDFLKIIREVLPEDGYFVDEVTQVGFVSWYGFPVYEPRHFITAGYQGTLGYGFPTALGVKVAHPDKKVVAIAGDGGFMFNVQEMATAVQHHIDLVTIVFNNHQYGNVQRQQKEWFDGRIIASDLHNPDFVKLAESFGAAGYRVQGAEPLRHALEDAFQQKGPSLIEVEVGEMPTPWEFILHPQIRSNPVKSGE